MGVCVCVRAYVYDKLIINDRDLPGFDECYSFVEICHGHDWQERAEILMNKTDNRQSYNKTDKKIMMVSVQ